MLRQVSSEKVKQLVTDEHYKRLKWASKNAGKVVPWRELATDEFRICTVVEGIYKPKWTEYTLSTKQLIDSPYADKLPVVGSDGSWKYEYFQKGQDPAKMEIFAQNRGLMKCKKEGVPVIVCIQQTKKPKEVTYLIQGIGIVNRWSDDGYFHIEGVTLESKPSNVDGKYTNELAESSKAEEQYNPKSEDDGRTRAFRAISIRRGQPKFRNSLLQAYEGKCAITSTNLESVLEAAHITKYNGEQSNVVSNGLLLRADVHTLWDLGLLALTSDFKVIIAPSLRESIYGELEGRQIHLPKDPTQWPSQNCLAHHRDIFEI